MDEGLVYKHMDLRALESEFAAKSADGVDGTNFHFTMSKYHFLSGTDTLTSTIRRLSRESTVTVIDKRRANNCAILLTKLKMSNQQLRQAVMSMDRGNELQKDMVEQVYGLIKRKSLVNITTSAPEIRANV